MFKYQFWAMIFFLIQFFCLMSWDFWWHCFSASSTTIIIGGLSGSRFDLKSLKGSQFDSRRLQTFRLTIPTPVCQCSSSSINSYQRVAKWLYAILKYVFKKLTCRSDAYFPTTPPKTCPMSNICPATMSLKNWSEWSHTKSEIQCLPHRKFLPCWRLHLSILNYS